VRWAGALYRATSTSYASRSPALARAIAVASSVLPPPLLQRPPRLPLVRPGRELGSIDGPVRGFVAWAESFPTAAATG
ncbi:MAG TPA: hypothetical protein VKE25_04050, partial [Actinomycetes bacterium]|nr:hypothetical protein [Actinomycetes bacterium]